MKKIFHQGGRAILLLSILLFTLGVEGAQTVYAVAPDNDEIQGALPINSLTYVNTVNTTDSSTYDVWKPETNNPGVQRGPCVDVGNPILAEGFKSAWYVYTPPENQTIEANTIGSINLSPGSDYGTPLDTYIVIWEMTGGTLIDPVLDLYACNDDYSGGFTSRFTWDGNAGTTYFIEIAQFGGISTDPYDPSSAVPALLKFNANITNIDVMIGNDLVGAYYLTSGESRVESYVIDGGPVEIVSSNGMDIVASLNQQRRRPGITAWTGVTQSMALPVEQISNQYVMPRYDYTSPTTKLNQVLIANVDTVSRDITVTIGGTLMGNYTLNPSQSQYLRYNGVVGGPIVVSSDVGAKIVASLYELVRDPATAGWNGQSEMMGLSSSQLSDKYLIPMYFGASSPSTLVPSLYIANVDAIATIVEVKIAGISRGTYSMQPNTSRVVNYVIDGGPVEIQSNNGAKIVVSLNQQRRRPGTTPWTGVSQSMALPVGLITNQYVMPRYDYTSPTTKLNQVLIANVDTVTRDITVTIGGTLMGTYTLNPSQSQYLRYDGVIGGPIVVSSDAGAKIVTSLYELVRDPSLAGWNDQSEMMGLPWEQLSDQYLIPMYFGASSPSTLIPSVYFGVP